MVEPNAQIGNFLIRREGPSGSGRRAPTASRLARFGSPVVLALLFWWFQGRYGFNPTDDGFVLAQSWRLLHGEIPHVDFTSPRPLGSAILHLPEVLLPWGTLAFSRLLVTFQLVWVAIATVDLFPTVRERSVLERLSLVTIAFLLAVGTWPLMAWHTIDGIFIGVTVLWLAMREAPRSRWRHVQWGGLWLLAGFAPLVKQGFVIVPVLAAMVLIAQRRWAALRYAPVGAVPGALYLLFTAATPGGLLRQLYSGSARELLRPLKTLMYTVIGTNGLIVLVGVVAAVLLLRLGRRPRGINVALAIGLVTGPTLLLGRAESFSLGGSLPYVAVITVLALAGLLVRDVRRLAVVVALLGLAYSASMSWGVPAPSLLVGPLVVCAIMLVLEEGTTLSSGLLDRRAVLAAVLVLVVLVTVLVLQARSKFTYAELPRAGLSATVDDPRFAFILMSPQSSAYVEGVKQCIARHPASDVAVLPDGPGLYPLLGIHNPFEIDWWLNAEQSPDHPGRVDATIDALNARGDWLVLVQSYSLFELPKLALDEVDDRGRPFAYTAADKAILDRLNGESVECGSLSGEYMAP